MPQMAPSSARGAQLLLPSSKPAQAAPSFTPKDQPSTSPSPGLTPSRPQATEDEALRAAVAEARQGEAAVRGPPALNPPALFVLCRAKETIVPCK